VGCDRCCIDSAELVQADRADDAVRVAAGGEVHRHRAGHDQRVQQRLVAVAVDEHHVAARHRAMPDDLVGGGGAVGDEEGMVGAEVACRLVLGVLIGPVWSSSEPSSGTEIDRSLRGVFSP
jgi:hypothetical protein